MLWRASPGARGQLTENITQTAVRSVLGGLAVV
jgi:hypothetical protein